MTTWVLTIACHDRPGIVHAVSGAIVAAHGNISEAQQFSSTDTGRFYQRIQIDTDAPRDRVEAALAPVMSDLDADWHLDLADRPLRTLVLASKASHVVNDLLYRQRSGYLNVDVPLIVANHPDLAPLAGFYGVRFESHTVLPDDQAPGSKAAFENRVREAVAEHDIELVVLARYMQILSPELCADLSGRAINIHHSFLPGFKGANPYRQAHARGVKLIGATAHFVTSDLDEGPIIEQNVVRVNHAQTPKQLMAIGQDQESRTLREAVRLVAEHRVFLDGARTVIF